MGSSSGLSTLSEGSDVLALVQATIRAMGADDYRRTGAVKGMGRQTRERDLCRSEGEHPDRTDVGIVKASRSGGAGQRRSRSGQERCPIGTRPLCCF